MCDVRDILRLCVDFGRIEEKSYQFFMDFFVPLNNRLCVGPPLVRIQELLALIQANVVNIIYQAKARARKCTKI
ncbi:Uncharacterised protein [Helicobacter mustelae]|nr:Uncharacterised protein [Helicobacter mustelae]STP12957.1 Uncharacterised protein [Helicobacter mustelae]STP14176.1 Uncharacterised protein [Helicobacter mustelae]